MANPRRNNPYPFTTNNEIPIYNHTHTQTIPSRLHLFLKKPQSFPFLLSLFLILTWVFLRFHQTHPHPHPKTITPTTDQDHEANLIRFNSHFPSRITKDTRGWLLDPVSIAKDSGVTGGAVSCVSLHVGEIKPGGVRGNHRHYGCNETILIWGGRTMFRLENSSGVGKGYGEVVVEAGEVAVAGSPSGTAHAFVNVDVGRSSFIIGCQDCVVTYNKSRSDFGVWDDLKV